MSSTDIQSGDFLFKAVPLALQLLKMSSLRDMYINRQEIPLCGKVKKYCRRLARIAPLTQQVEYSHGKRKVAGSSPARGRARFATNFLSRLA